MSGVQVTNFGNTLGLPAGYVEAITAIVTDEIKFCVQNTTINGTGGQVPSFQNPQLVKATNVVIDNSDNLSVGGTVTVGNNVPATNYTLPAAIGVPQQVLQVPAAGNVLEWANNATTIPTFLNTLVVDELSQGPNGLSKNYTFPQYPPPIDTILGNNGTQGFVVNIPATIDCQFFATYSNPLRLATINIPILAGDYIPDDLTNIISVALRDNLAANNVIANIFIGFDPLIQRYGMRLSPGSVDFTSMIWQIYVNGTNNNDVFGLTTGNALVTPAAPGIVYGPDAPLYLNATGELVWRSVISNQITSDNSNSVIECSELSGIISYGDYNINNGSINNCGNINALDNCNITTGTTQIVNGLSELNINIDSLPRITQNAIKTKLECGVSSLQLAAVSDGLSADTVTYIGASNIGNTQNTISIYLPDEYLVIQNNAAIQRIVVDNAGTKLYSKSVQTGPSGSYLNLNDDSSFSLGSYFAGNGSVECSTNSLALVGPQAKSSFVLTDATITTSLFNGSYRADREIMDATSQVFKDGNLAERIRIDNNGVAINGEYALPLLDGLANQVLTTSGAGITSWQTPVAANPFNQTLNTTDDVSFNTVTTSKIDALTTLTIGGLSATSVNIGKAAITTTLKGTTSIDSLFTLPTTTGTTGQVLTRNSGSSSIWQTPQLYGLYSQTGTTTVANTTVETTLIGSGVGSLSVPANYFTTGMAFRYNTGGTFRDNANNTTFRFRLRNGGILFDSGNLTLPLITVVSAWNIDVTFSYVGGTTIITNFNFQYNNGSDARGFTSQNTNNTLNTTIPNTLNFTVQWGAASANNTITSNFGVLQKIY